MCLNHASREDFPKILQNVMKRVFYLSSGDRIIEGIGIVTEIGKREELVSRETGGNLSEMEGMNHDAKAQHEQSLQILRAGC